MQPNPRSVVFATPTLRNEVSVEYTRSALLTTGELLTHGFNPSWMMLGLSPYLAHVRNKLMTMFLRDFPDCDDFFFIDDDIGWPPHKAVEFIMNPNPVVSGIYPKKQADVDFPVTLAADSDGKVIQDQGFVLAKEVPTGFLRIKRCVLEKLAETSGTYIDLVEGKPAKFTEFCKVGTDALDANGWYVGEDYDLSRRIIAAGFSIWVDPDIEFTHRGTNLWRNSLKGWLPKFGLANRDVAA